MAGGQPGWSFDRVRLGAHECDAWVGYHCRNWGPVLTAAVGMVRVGFGMSWPATVRGAWHVLRGNQLWASDPDNDPDGPGGRWPGSTPWSRGLRDGRSIRSRQPGWRWAGGATGARPV